VVSYSARYGAIKTKLNHEGREEHEGQASQHESLDSVFELGDVEVNEHPREPIQAVLGLAHLAPRLHNRPRDSKESRTPSFVLFAPFVVTKSRLQTNWLWNTGIHAVPGFEHLCKVEPPPGLA
jgi:hypothetical protein